MILWSIAFSILFNIVNCQQSGRLPSLVDSSNAFLVKEYIDAITAYGPGLGVYSPYSYVDVSYDNIPGIGKIPLIGKEGTSSGLKVSPFYPPQGNPGNPFPPLYRARPLPPNIPEPVDVVAVPLDEEALHGEPLFPPELTLPSDKSLSDNGAEKESDTTATEKPPGNPFGGDERHEEKEREVNEDNLVEWSTNSQGNGQDSVQENTVSDSADEVFFEDSAKEGSTTMEKMEEQREKEEPLELSPKSPFASVTRRKRVKRLAEILGL